MGVSKKSIGKFLIGNRFHVKLCILSPYSNRRMRNFTWNRFPIKNLLIDSLLTPIVESTYLNRGMCTFESSQKDESRWQSTDSSKAYTSAFKCSNIVVLSTWKINEMGLVRMVEKGSKTILRRGFTESIKENILKTIKLTEDTDIRKAMAIHWREASDGQEYWLMHWGWLKSDQTCTQANMLAVFPLTTARDSRWWSHCRSLGSPEMSTSFFGRQLKKVAVDFPYTPVVSIATGWK